MTTHSSATAHQETPHETETTKITVSDAHATVSEKGAGGMSQIMESDVRQTSFDTSCVK